MAIFNSHNNFNEENGLDIPTMVFTISLATPQLFLYQYYQYYWIQDLMSIIGSILFRHIALLLNCFSKTHPDISSSDFCYGHEFRVNVHTRDRKLLFSYVTSFYLLFLIINQVIKRQKKLYTVTLCSLLGCCSHLIQLYLE